MQYPILQEVAQYREMTTVFGGYNHQLSCQEGQFFDMKNMTTQYFPILSPRGNRGTVQSFGNPQGIIDKGDMMWMEFNKLYINGEEKVLKDKDGNTLLYPDIYGGSATLLKMGAYVIILPHKIWYNVEKDEGGYIEATYESDDFALVTEPYASLCDANGKVIEYKDASYYEKEENVPKDGDYMMSSKNGKPSLKVYASTTKTWLTVATTYIQINCKGIGKKFEKEDGIKITANTQIDISGNSWEHILVNKEERGGWSTNTWIMDKTDDSITIPGLFKANEGNVSSVAMSLKVERKMPDMAFITECNNRLWGCSVDGHEIYCSKLGDVTNWNCFRGISTDSWAATIGSDGLFTGATTYLGYPMFFKEDSLIKIGVSATGGHQVKETKCRGVQKGSEKSLNIINEVLYYKSATCVCGYNGSLPYSVSDELGDVRYKNAVAGGIGDRYYISMADADGKYNMFVYDTKQGLWCKEDDTEVLSFCRNNDELYYIDAKDNMLKSVRGTLPSFGNENTTEDKFDWYVESGTIGYSLPDNKYVSRINLRITLEFGTNVDFYIQYDSSGEWEHKFNMCGKGTRAYSIPIIPKRCDHFKYKLTGKGGCKIHSITKTMEEGSDD